jgi:hypothetical protein
VALGAGFTKHYRAADSGQLAVIMVKIILALSINSCKAYLHPYLQLIAKPNYERHSST